MPRRHCGRQTIAALADQARKAAARLFADVLSRPSQRRLVTGAEREADAGRPDEPRGVRPEPQDRRGPTLTRVICPWDATEAARRLYAFRARRQSIRDGAHEQEQLMRYLILAALAGLTATPALADVVVDPSAPWPQR